MVKNQQLEALIEHFQERTHGHAYLLFGGTIEERADAARVCAEFLTGGTMDSRNPDAVMVRPEKDKDQISIAQVRELEHFFSLKPYFGKGRIAILNGADRMDEAAQSALLKTLEEPPAEGALILLADRPGLLLPTVLSRVQQVRLSGTHEGIDKNNDMVYTLLGLIQAHTAERLSIIERIAKDDETDTQDVLFVWISFFRDLSHLSLGMGEDTIKHSFCLPEMRKTLKERQYTPSRIGEILSEFLRTSFALHATHMNKRLTLEYLSLLI